MVWGSNSGKGERVLLLRNVQTGSGSHPVFYFMGTLAWIWPFNAIQCQAEEWVELYLHTRCMRLWRGQRQLYLLPLYYYVQSVFCSYILLNFTCRHLWFFGKGTAIIKARILLTPRSLLGIIQLSSNFLRFSLYHLRLGNGIIHRSLVSLRHWCMPLLKITI
jgi:hypothetical protein